MPLTLPATLTQTYKAGASYQSQQLNTQLTGQPPGSDQTLPADSATNNLSWKRYRLYAEAQLDFANRDQGQKATLRLPVSWISTRITNTPPATKRDHSPCLLRTRAYPPALPKGPKRHPPPHRLQQRSRQHAQLL